jgi:hypothetical protein
MPRLLSSQFEHPDLLQASCMKGAISDIRVNAAPGRQIFCVACTPNEAI